MKRFLVIYHSPISASEMMAHATPEQAKAGMEAWMNWSKKNAKSVVDLGMPLGKGTAVSPDSTSKSTTTATGYSILQGESMESIVQILRDHPHFRMPGGSSIEVFEGLPIPGM
jgi:hypothetical protein